MTGTAFLDGEWSLERDAVAQAHAFFGWLLAEAPIEVRVPGTDLGPPPLDMVPGCRRGLPAPGDAAFYGSCVHSDDVSSAGDEEEGEETTDDEGDASDVSASE